MKTALAAIAAVPFAVTVLLGGAFSSEGAAPVEAGINVSALPDLARQLLPQLEVDLRSTCPDLPTLWVLAETESESGWDPRAFSAAGAAGLLQMMPGTWLAVGGAGSSWTTSAPPVGTHPVWDPRRHLQTAIRWMCSNMHAVQQHLRVTGKPLEVLDALAVCHIAGCSRVFASTTGIPRPGDAGCGTGCVTQIRNYLDSIHRNVVRFAGSVQVNGAPGSAPQPFVGPATGCSLPDPTGTGGCVSGATAWLVGQVATHVDTGPVSCWSARPGDPYSDHPRGQACDYVMGHIGSFADTADVARGWRLATWLRTYAAPLRVAYVIWQGRIWSLARDPEGWRPYTGGGVYDPNDVTTGHYDHVHVSTVM